MVIVGNEEAVKQLVEDALKKGLDPEKIIDDGLIAAMDEVGFGYLVVEVKEGQYQYFNNLWQKQLGRDYVDVEKDPVKQTETAM